ncbi:hypothetical protein HUW63_34555 [Myxococcus sp. AM001]|nr:hypothetical protein [Myxococcus sp. AM001]
MAISSLGAPESKLTLPVRAWANNQFLLLYDESKVLSATGKLRLSRTNPKVEFGWLPSTTASGDRTVVDAMTASINDIAGFPNVAASTQSLSGVFRLHVAGSLIEVDYALSKPRFVILDQVGEQTGAKRTGRKSRGTSRSALCAQKT